MRTKEEQEELDRRRGLADTARTMMQVWRQKYLSLPNGLEQLQAQRECIMWRDVYAVRLEEVEAYLLPLIARERLWPTE